jgi:hypothetical protein
MDNKNRSKHKFKFGQPMLTSKNGFNKKNIPYIYPTLIILAINIVFIVTIIFITNKLPPQVPLYYGFPRGELQLASPIALVLPLALSSLFITLNSIFAYFTKSVFLKNILVIGSFFASLLSAITVIKIILLTISF